MPQTILLIATASIACYKAADIIRRLHARGIAAQVMLTPDAQKLIGAPTFRALSGRPVLTDEWKTPASPDGMDHIAAVRAADALLVAPATADFIAKAANGICDSLPLAAFAAADIPKFISPAMNAKMWQNPANTRNIAQLKNDGVTFLGPVSGEQACGETGPGRMMEADDIVSQLLSKFPQKSPLSGKKIVVNTGATVEKLDPMRVITNLSTGKMGFAVADAIRRAGGEAVVIAAQTSAPPPADIRIRRVQTGAEMLRALLSETADADAFIAVAAIADFRPKHAAPKKIKRASNFITLELTPAPDILAEIIKARPALFCAGFAAETGPADKMTAAARTKMRQKGARMFVANSTADAGRDDCKLTLITEKDAEPLPRQSKTEAARTIIQRISDILTNRPNFEKTGKFPPKTPAKTTNKKN